MKTFRKSCMRYLSSRQGSVLILAFLILVLASSAAIFSTNTTNMETRIAANEKSATMAFYTAEAGISPGIQVLDSTLNTRAVPVFDANSGLAWSSTTAAVDFLNEVLGVNTTVNGSGFAYSAPNSTQTGLSAQVNVRRQGPSISSSGGSTEFGAGSEGIGYGAAGGVVLLYRISSTGTGTSNTSSQVEVEYRKLLKGSK